MEAKSFETLFVGGAPRTGTTILHAILCTSPLVNRYIGECSYFSAFMEPYRHGVLAYDVHTKHYFSSLAAFREFHGSILERVLEHLWAAAETPPILALKDPLLTAHFPLLAELLPKARFIVIVRDPRDAVLSLCEVYKRMHGTSELAEHLSVACDQYASVYKAISSNLEKFGNRLLLINYNLLVSGGELDKLAAFGIEGLSLENVWKDARTNVYEYAGGDWWTDLYGTGVSPVSIGRYADKLNQEMISRIDETCRAVFDQLLDQNCARGSLPQIASISSQQI
ncbi:MAG: hypothetical protein C5B53_10790 [Candidatus Melainabacteria bacterium]|nr:MAG: hypothetical protein C5B53_10790 [Candidatus Melainabacteria bacterium]